MVGRGNARRLQNTIWIHTDRFGDYLTSPSIKKVDLVIAQTVLALWFLSFACLVCQDLLCQDLAVSTYLPRRALNFLAQLSILRIPGFPGVIALASTCVA